APKAMIRAGLAQPGELWLATAAVYGFQRSPKWWSQHRNATTKTATWKSPKGGSMKVVPCITDDNLHKLVEVLPDGEHIVGYVLFYVDDTLAVGLPEYVHGFYDWLEATWETSGREQVSKEGVVRFLGLELSLDEAGKMMIGQRGYVDELLRKREVTTYSKVPFVKEWATDEIPKDADCAPELVKEAQQRCGEILWATQRSRPDAAYAAMMMSKLTTRWPERAIVIAKKILTYFNATREAGFVIGRDLPQGLMMFSDASHAPTGAKSISGSLVMWRGMPICWRSANQGLTALSSAEAELIALSEGTQLVRAVRTTLEDMGISPGTTELRVDATVMDAYGRVGLHKGTVNLNEEIGGGGSSFYHESGISIDYSSSSHNRSSNSQHNSNRAWRGVDSDYELWLAVMLIAVTTVVVWEWSKKTAGGVKKVVKMKMFKPADRRGLSKSEGKELLELLSCDDRSREQEARLMVLVGKFKAHDQDALPSTTTSQSSASGPVNRGRDAISAGDAGLRGLSNEKFQPEKWSRGVQTDPVEVPPEAMIRPSVVDGGIRYVVQPWE
ncbi:RE1, partial [Symbiodinium necroappetens]